MDKREKSLEQNVKQSGLTERQLDKLREEVERIAIREFKNLGFSREIAEDNLDEIYSEYLHVISDFSNSLDKTINEQYESVMKDFGDEENEKSSLYMVLGSLTIRGEFSNEELTRVSGEIMRKTHQRS